MKTFEDPTTKAIIQCICRVHRILGPGFLECIYRRALLKELRTAGLQAETEKEIDVVYEGEVVGQHRLDLLVQGTVVIELKTVEALGKAHYAQIRSYLKATRLRVGILVNFATALADFRRVENTDFVSISPPIP